MPGKNAGIGGMDAGVAAGIDGMDAGIAAGIDGMDAGIAAADIDGLEAGIDGMEAGIDAGMEAGKDARNAEASGYDGGAGGKDTGICAKAGIWAKAFICGKENAT